MVDDDGASRHAVHGSPVLGVGHEEENTDGWALFLESLERVQATESEQFSPDDRQKLESIRATGPQGRLPAMTV